MRHVVRARRGRWLSAATLWAVAALIAGAFALAGPARAATPSPRALPGTRPAWATVAAQRGVTPPGVTISARVYLAGRDPAGLAAYARAVSAPGSAQYGHYLTPAAQQTAFGPTPSQVRKVTSWLARSGLKITGVTEQQVSVTGTAAAAGRAFGTQLRDYAFSGQIYYAPSANAVVPAAVTPAVLGVSGLNNAPMVARAAAVPTPARVSRVVRAKGAPPYIGSSPCSAYWGQKTAAGLPAAYGHSSPLPVCGYTPGQLRDAYGIGKTGLTGKGVTVAVVDAYGSPTIAPDVNTFARYNHVPQFGRGQLQQIVTPAQWHSQAACGGPAGWKPEESLDVEAVHTMAPAARVLYVGANSCQDSDFLSAFANIIDHRLATIVTNSWDENLLDYSGDESASTIQAYTQAFEQAATEGIGFYFSSGDCSTSDPGIVGNGLNCDPNSSQPQVGFPASDPWATGVGATAIGIGARHNYLFETGMGDSQAAVADRSSWSSLPGSFLFGAGGGTSSYFPQPSYQRTVVPFTLAHMLLTGRYSTAPMRVVPDVAMEGDLFAATMAGFTQPLPGGSTGWAEAGYGGTSVASPLFAGVQADAQQSARFPVGFANPEIYQRYLRRDLGAFRDVSDHPGGATFAAAVGGPLSGGVHQGTLFTLGSDFTLQATPGYDDVTGVGTPTPAYLKSFGRSSGRPAPRR
jgi:subtilase family serine protease